MSIETSQIERYYDSHQTELEEEELGQSRSHFFAIQYLLLVLQWLFESKGQKVGIVSEIGFYQTENPQETPKQPDLAVVDGLEVVPANEEDTSPSYYVGADGPPPRIVFEIASQQTWQADLEEKPGVYARMGVREYIAYDPQSKLGVWTRQWRNKQRLVGWRLQADGSYAELAKDEQGRIWSEELESWLMVRHRRLQLYSAEGELRVNQAEAEQQRAEAAQQRAEAERRNAEAERGRAERAELKAFVSQRKAEEEGQRANQEAQRAELAQRKAEEEGQRAELAQRKAEEEGQRAEEESRRAEASEQARQALAAENARLLEKLRQLEQKDN